MSFLSDVLTSVGGTGHVSFIRIAGTGQTVSSGKLTTWDDARGNSGYGPTATGFGSPKPAVDAITGAVTCDGSQNYYTTPSSSVFDITIPGTWIFVGIIPNSSIGVNVVDDPLSYGNHDAMIGTSGGIEAYFHNGVSRGRTSDGLQIVIKSFAGGSPSGSATAGDSWRMLQTVGHVPSYPTGEIAFSPASWTSKTYRLGDWTNGPGFNSATVEYFSMWVDHPLTQAEYTSLTALLSAQYSPFIETTKGSIIFDGDSRTAGAGVADVTTDSYPAQALAALALTDYEGANYGVNSRDIHQQNTVFDARVGTLYRSDKTGKQQIVAIWPSYINDIAAGYTALQTKTAFINLCAAAKAAGYKVVVTTEIPWGAGPGYPTSDVNAFNSYIRANYLTLGDELADIANITELQDPNDATYFQSDKIHPTAAGLGKVATHATYGVAAAIQRLLTPASNTPGGGSFFFT